MLNVRLNHDFGVGLAGSVPAEGSLLDIWGSSDCSCGDVAGSIIDRINVSDNSCTTDQEVRKLELKSLPCRRIREVGLLDEGEVMLEVVMCVEGSKASEPSRMRVMSLVASSRLRAMAGSM